MLLKKRLFVGKVPHLFLLYPSSPVKYIPSGSTERGIMIILPTDVASKALQCSIFLDLCVCLG